PLRIQQSLPHPARGRGTGDQRQVDGRPAGGNGRTGRPPVVHRLPGASRVPVDPARRPSPLHRLRPRRARAQGWRQAPEGSERVKSFATDLRGCTRIYADEAEARWFAVTAAVPAFSIASASALSVKIRSYPRKSVAKKGLCE